MKTTGLLAAAMGLLGGMSGMTTEPNRGNFNHKGRAKRKRKNAAKKRHAANEQRLAIAAVKRISDPMLVGNAVSRKVTG